MRKLKFNRDNNVNEMLGTGLGVEMAEAIVKSEMRTTSARYRNGVITQKQWSETMATLTNVFLELQDLSGEYLPKITAGGNLEMTFDFENGNYKISNYKGKRG